MKGREGYVTVEAAVLLPFASVVILLLVWLSSYLYQGCFMVQASYASAFRGSRYAARGAEYVEKQLDGLLEGEVLSFEAESRRVDVGAFAVEVELEKNTPLSGIFLGTKELVPGLHAKWKVMVRNPVSYIRAIRTIGGALED